jgi:arginyl-tRNA synthetase
MPKRIIASLLNGALSELGMPRQFDFQVDLSPRKEYGDYASNLAIVYGRKLSRNPLETAKNVAAAVKALDREGIFEKIEVAPPGFINFTLSSHFLQSSLLMIKKQDQDWGRSKAEKSNKVLLEFVSANPTGPLHVGHGRWAVIGDIIGRLLDMTGKEVAREFYINNMGNQVEKLVQSVKAVREGKAVPDGGYGGAYIKEVRGESKEEIVDFMLRQQKQTLTALGVNYDRWYYESELHEKDLVRGAVEKLRALGKTFEEDGAIWFKSQELGDDKNRVLIRADGQPTYFAADIAYHLDKFGRGYDHLIDIWGTDHHGYVGRLKAALRVLDQPVESFEIIIGQLVTLYRGNEPVRMSKRTGEMVTLQEVMCEIGADATRFFFSASDVNSHLDFDLELAKKKSHENPVYYVQYAHARICSILKKDAGQGGENDTDLSDLNHPAERELIIKLLSFPDLVEQAAYLRHPHRITEYGKELATAFHHFYEKCRVLGSPSRLFLVDATRIVLRNMLELLGISAPESM